MNGDSAHPTSGAAIVVQRVVHGRSVVPDNDIACAPSVPDGQLRLRAMCKQQSQEVFALRSRESHDVLGETRINEEPKTTGHRMHPHHRVNDGWHAERIFKQPVCIISTQCRVEWLTPVCKRRDLVYRPQLCDENLQRWSQTVMRVSQARPHRVASVCRQFVGHQYRRSWW